ncbi:hypothetical protein [Sporomusa sp. KB1]|jgi:hypothetical protein|uniref:hypothetical protein n=1 Tax=Sporomusa sp. KB1 TaxID=943346 RepID=UPI0011ADFB62|nr:hypothetical protein [Sporomusa sp. KB1]TWH47799.1 hypothetical protein Salpa_3885 [Sporomusa sp. KB1]
MKQVLSDLCRQLRLAYVSDALAQKSIPELSAVVTEVLQAEIDGRQRMKLNRLIHKAGFPQLKTLDGYSFEKIAFPSSVNQEKLEIFLPHLAKPPCVERSAA